MLIDIVEVRPLENYSLYLRFEDGREGEIDLAEMIDFSGVYAPLRDPAYFRQVRVNPDLGTICWPNSADVDPDVLYSVVTGEPLLEPASA
jgi:hypothetical protein